jgi:hypothetical protein
LALRRIKLDGTNTITTECSEQIKRMAGSDLKSGLNFGKNCL